MDVAVFLLLSILLWRVGVQVRLGGMLSEDFVMNGKIRFYVAMSLFQFPLLKEAWLEYYLLTLFFGLCLDSYKAFVYFPSTSVNAIIYYRLNPKS